MKRRLPSTALLSALDDLLAPLNNPLFVDEIAEQKCVFPFSIRLYHCVGFTNQLDNQQVYLCQHEDGS